MKAEEVRKQAFSMPLHSPAYPPGPYRFVNREYMIINYRTDRAALERVVPKPLQITDPIVKYEFIRMPDSTGFGDYTESGQVIPVRFEGSTGGYVHAMFLDDDPPIAGGRELWGFPKKLASPSLRVEHDTLLGTLDFGPVRIATGSKMAPRILYSHGPWIPTAFPVLNDSAWVAACTTTMSSTAPWGYQPPRPADPGRR